MFKRLFCLLRIVVIVHLLYCMVKGMLTAIFICLFNLILLNFASLLKKKIKYSNILQLMIYLFLICSLLGSNIYHLYDIVWCFDIVMHVLSSFIISWLFFYILRYFNVKMNSFLVVLFLFSFSMMIEGIWEITEFGIDRVFNSDMQKDTVINEVKSTLLSDDKKSVVSIDIYGMEVGNVYFDGYLDIGLYDTMEDMICGVGGSVLYIIFGKINKSF